MSVAIIVSLTSVQTYVTSQGPDYAGFLFILDHLDLAILVLFFAVGFPNRRRALP
jgi:hypothetical protein